MRTDRVLRRIAATAVFVVVLGLGPASAGPAGSPLTPSTPPMLDAAGLPVRSSVASLEPVMLGGSRQWLLLRGRDIWNPLLLYVGGEPGTSHLAWTHRYVSELENHFIVVTWEPRGTGKSYAGRAAAPPTLDEYVQDTIELARTLTARFRQERVFLVGHGFGAMVGALAVQERPELFAAFVAVAPMVDPARNEQAEYQLTQDVATRVGDNAALIQLKTIGRPPYGGKAMAQQYRILHDVAARLEEEGYPANDFRNTRLAAIAGAPEYTPLERARLSVAAADTFRAIYPQALQITLEDRLPALAVPVYFMLGRHDVTLSSPAIAERYFHALRAPVKALYWFHDAGSVPHFEEPAKFVQIMVSRVLADSMQRIDVTH